MEPGRSLPEHLKQIGVALTPTLMTPATADPAEYNPRKGAAYDDGWPTILFNQNNLGSYHKQLLYARLQRVRSSVSRRAARSTHLIRSPEAIPKGRKPARLCPPARSQVLY